ncbi:ketoacyl-ACP synthase III [Chryseobacterium wangxinyae]|uniref:3-oxoacyl-ACP synthase III family protein n=1 Tax=Chryseobacterium sp. CY350 TaxID=2997336 RepID=UPI0022709E8D|nr:ketoacyl-ACP synthase III [Chryseobacterium sp. CY350]MCY0976886.1 ketoacyl-ACP synthase III [Chryseobacterium sp. CY350]WBZ96885.1 ketoacyl-ACP synthase III [Chryseobacterium sp. CY350]
MTSKIIGVGSYLPSEIIPNSFFQNHHFLDENGKELMQNNAVIAEKLTEITGIHERRYASENLVASDLGFFAAREAIKDAQIDPESIDYIIFAQNFGDICYGKIQSDAVPSLAARVKHQLRIKNNYCVAYDVLFGCPGWIEGVIQGHAFIRAGIAKTCLIIGAETLSRVVDAHDRDSMIFADGAGAVIIQASRGEAGIQSHTSASFTLNEKNYLDFRNSYNREDRSATKFMKMNGRKIYEFALSKVPQAMKKCLDDSGFAIHNLNKILIHQANEKMDEEIIKRFYKLYDIPVPDDIMPMIISKTGNSSVATIPTLLSMILNNELPNHQLRENDIVLFASVGAGMNINAFVYKF